MTEDAPSATQEGSTTERQSLTAAVYIDRDVPTIYAEAIMGASIGFGTVKLTFVETVFNPDSQSPAIRPTHHLVMSPEAFENFVEFMRKFGKDMPAQARGSEAPMASPAVES